MKHYELYDDTWHFIMCLDVREAQAIEAAVECGASIIKYYDDDEKRHIIELK